MRAACARKITILLLLIFGMLIFASPAFASLSYQELYSSKQNGDGVLIIVESNILEPVSSAIRNYISDLEAEGYAVTLSAYSSGSAEELKDYIKLFYPGLKGALLVGSLPAAYFEINNDFGTGVYAKFPADLFFMDLDGSWQDSNGNGVYDVHRGETSAEIWIGRIDASILYDPQDTMDEAGRIRNYFLKNSAFRRGRFRVASRALVDDGMFLGNYGDQGLLAAFAEVNSPQQNNQEANIAFFDKIKQGYELAHLNGYATPSGHTLSDGSMLSLETIRSADPKVAFYNLIGGNACLYQSSNYIGGALLFAPKGGLAVIGSSKIGGMLEPETFYSYAGEVNQKCVGDALIAWYNAQATDSPALDSWHYGITLLGDPTLRLDPPIASINLAELKLTGTGETMVFRGSGAIRNGNIQKHAWRSSKDGFLSSESECTRSDLSAGKHVIYFKVQDSWGRWSSEAERTIEVAPN